MVRDLTLKQATDQAGVYLFITAYTVVKSFLYVYLTLRLVAFTFDEKHQGQYRVSVFLTSTYLSLRFKFSYNHFEYVF